MSPRRLRLDSNLNICTAVLNKQNKPIRPVKRHKNHPRFRCTSKNICLSWSPITMSLNLVNFSAERLLVNMSAANSSVCLWQILISPKETYSLNELNSIPKCLDCLCTLHAPDAKRISSVVLKNNSRPNISEKTKASLKISLPNIFFP